MSYPGIEIRIRTLDGEYLWDNSDAIHFSLCHFLTENNWPADTWVTIGGTWLKDAMIEIRPVELEELPAAPDDVSELTAPAAAGQTAAAETRRLRFSWPVARIGRIARIGRFRSGR